MNDKLELVITENLIGETIVVTYHDNDFRCQGTVIDETKNTIVVKDSKDSKIKRFPKSRINIERNYKNNRIKIKGSLLKGRIEERLKNEPKKLW